MDRQFAMQSVFLDVAVLHMNVLAMGRKKERLVLVNEGLLGDPTAGN